MFANSVRYNVGVKNTTYIQSVHEWRQERNETIRKENGWLALSGLYWLNPGTNLLGSDPKSDILLPKRLPANLGKLEYNNGIIFFQTESAQKIKINGLETDFAILQPEPSNDPSYITIQDVRFVVIQRGDKFAVRIWDNQREERRLFPARTWFDINEEFRLPAAFTPYDRPKMSYFPGVTGEKSEFPVEGYLSFQFNNKDYQLDINKEDDGTFFIRFSDPTSKDETYPTGRYLVADEEADGKIFIDFNKAYCPPCAFTDFATCVFAPDQNQLDFKVTVGETYQRH